MAFHTRSWRRLIQLLVCISLKLKPRTQLLFQREFSQDSSCYKKPKTTVAANELPLPAYNVGERSGPPPRPYTAIDATDVIADAFKKNLLWFIARLHSQHNQTIGIAGQDSIY